MVSQSQFAERVQECTDRLTATGVDALGALFDLTSHRLVRFAVAVTRNQHDAEDAVQTALVRLAGKPELLRPVGAPWPYLLRMVRNEALLVGRRKQRCHATGDLIDLVTFCPVDELEREECHRAVWSALRTLPPEQAEVVVLKIWEDMTFAQIGQILETSPNTVASRYQYAMTRLTRRLAGQQREAQRG
ncbi:MAG TPA: sigma-70 family RNA polymerase sigma factor [Lacipirellulaceae bacterium]|jgi:RNA polymerase sigma-70 factor (ECF subfamily)